MRVLYSDNGTLTDITKKVENYKSGTFAFNYVAGEDCFYIGSDLPLNHLFFKFQTLNLVPATVSVEYWSEGSWTPVVDIMDETDGFTSSNYIEFTPNKQAFWRRESTNDQGQSIPDLISVSIYDQFWIKVTLSVDLTPGTTLSWVGNLFSNDLDLFAELPSLNRPALMSHFQSGKTNWEEQHVRAADLLIKELKNRNIIRDPGQILRREDYRLASVSKCAQVIFTALGDDYVDDAVRAASEFKARVDSATPVIDQNMNAIPEVQEKLQKMGFISR